jgi:choline dehydrogenase-like flavoprotein
MDGAASGATLGADTIIIGAGSAGCVLANRLSADPSRQVLLLEAGQAAPLASTVPALWATMFNTEVDWGFHTVAQAGCRQRRLFWPRGRMVGGSGALNAMIYMRGLPSDYARWQAAGCPGWGWDDVLPAFKASEHNPRLAGSPWHGSGGLLPVNDISHIDPIEHAWLASAQAAGLPANDDFNGERQGGVGLFQATIAHGERCGTGRAFLAPALDRPNLRLLSGVTVLQLLFDGARASGVAFLRNGQRHEAHAQAQVVLCAGAIGSPQLLLLSGIGPADELAALGIRPRLNLPGVGRSLQDHVQCAITVATHDRHGIALATAAEAAAHQAQWQQTRGGPLASNWSACGGFARVAPVEAGREPLDDAGDPDVQLYCIASPHRDHGRWLGSAPGITLFSVLQRPASRGALTLRSADPLAAPVIDPRYFSDAGDGDLARVVEGIKLQRRILVQSPLRGLLADECAPSAGAQSDAALAALVRGHAATLYHPTSTCRMGSDDGAVVDPRLQVRGCDGLWVADASVFPSMVSGNTNAPVIMVAERAARFIAEDVAATTH